MNAPRAGLFGGSFNPPHNGHIAAAVAAIGALGLDRLVVMPAGCPPHKDLSPDVPSRRDRLALARLAFESVPACEVSDWEINHPAPVYSVDTLAYMRERGLSPVLVVGSDMFLTLHEWSRAGELLSSTPVAVLLREKAQAEDVSQYAAFLVKRYGAVVERVEHAPVEVSSTRLRALLKSGGSRPIGRSYLPESVYMYIEAHQLYGVGVEDGNEDENGDEDEADD